MEQLIILAIIIGASLVHGWWKKRQEQSQEEGEVPPSPGRRGPGPSPREVTRRPSTVADWEQELRRMLQGEEPVDRPPPPPPIVVTPPPVPRVRRAPILPPPPTFASESEGPARTRPLAQSAQAYLRGSQFASRVAAHMHGPGLHTAASHKIPGLAKEPALEIREALRLLRSRRSQRAAMIVSVILGPPKALEP